MIEAGHRWMSVQAVTTDVSSETSYLTQVESIVQHGELAQYAVGATEVAFFESNDVSLSYPPLLVAEDAGYNSGNAFTGETAMHALLWCQID